MQSMWRGSHEPAYKIERRGGNAGTMFVESELTWTVAVQPCDLKSGLHIQRGLLRKLLADFDKVKCSEKHGYHICVTTLEEVGEGKIWEGRGCVAYKVRFRCLTYKPQKHEKVFAVAGKEIHERGVMCSFGPMDDMFLTASDMKGQYTFVPQSETKAAHFKGDDGSVIESGSVLRVVIRGVKYNSLTRTYETVVSVAGHYLGVERRIWEDKSKPQATAGDGGDWGTKVDGGGNEAGGWGGDTHAEPGRGAWGDSPRESGGWGAAATEKANNGGAKSNVGWDNGSDKQAKSGYCWDDAPAEKSSGGGGWGEASPGRNTASGEKAKASVDSGTGADPGKEDAGGWGTSPAKKSKGGGWDTTIAEKDSSDFGAWGDAAPKKSSGAWDTMEVENTGGAWGD